MSAIAGIVVREGPPTDEAVFARMLERMAARGPDGTGQWTTGAVRFGHRLLHTTPESFRESQPVLSERGAPILVCDARLDNRHELIATLRARGATLRTDTDAELILRAYECWGQACLEHLVGDFAFAIWDQRRRQLFCARDPVGVKPFYYYWNGVQFLFASEIVALLSVPDVPKQMHAAMMVDYLLGDFRHPDATFFEDIHQLRPGHTLCMDDASLWVLPYWKPDPQAQRVSRRPEEYFERFRELFREAVRNRLRSHGPLGIMLSGGIDSVLVTALVHDLLREEPSPIPVTAFTVANEYMTDEERQAVRWLSETFQTEVRFLEPGPSEGSGDGPCRAEAPGEAFLSHPAALAEIAAKGCRVLLTGFGADELIGTSEAGILKDLLGAGRLAQLTRAIRRMAWAGRTPARSILLELLRTQIPAPLKRAAKTVLGRQAPEWVEPGLAKRLKLASGLAAPLPRTFPTMCQEESFRELTTPSMTLDLSQFDVASARAAVEPRHPFLDRRLIEFVLTIPPSVKMEAGPRKRFAQLALQDLVPVRDQEGEDPSASRSTRASRLAEVTRMKRLFGDPTGPLFWYVNAKAVPRLMEAYVEGNLHARTPLWRMLDLLRWMQTFFPEVFPAGNGHARERAELVAPIAGATFTGGGP